MKKVLSAVFTAAVLAILTALCVQGHSAAPALSDMEDVMALDPAGTVYLARMDGNHGVIYEVDSQGIIRDFYELPNSDRSRRTVPVQMAADDHRIYTVLKEESANSGRLTRWRIGRTDRETGESTIVSSLEAGFFSQVDDLVMDNGNLIVCGNLGEKYGTGDPIGLEKRIPVSGMADRYGRYLTGYAVNQEKDEAPVLLYLKRVPEGEMALDSAWVGKTVYLKTESGRVGRYTAGGYVDTIADAAAYNTGILVKGKDSLWYENRKFHWLEQLSQGEASCVNIPEGITLKAGIMTSGKAGVTLGETEAGNKVLTWHEGKLSRQKTAIRPSLQMSFLFSAPYVPRTAAFAGALAAFFLLAWWIYGKNGKISLKLSFLCLLTSVILGGMWLGFLKARGLSLSGEKRLAGAGICAAVILCAVFSAEVEYITRPLRSLSRYMDRVAAGNYELTKKPGSNDEVAGVWESMGKMCHELKARRYEYQRNLNSYYRFVPRDIYRIFNKRSIHELKAGDCVKLNQTVGIAAVSNRLALRLGMTDRVYMDLVRCCFTLVNDTCIRHGCVQASGEFHMAGTEILFLDEKGGPEIFGTELLEAGRERKGENGAAPEFFFLAHKTDYLYGLAGTGERAFPLFVSGEMEFLSSLTEKFEGLGVGMVMTDRAAAELPDSCSKRYIGFVNDPAGKKYPLYEILDVCTKEERLQKEALDDKFQEAVSMYYGNDFYLARNQFSAIIRENPGDGVARWYLFACEYYFNSGNVEAADYSLFYAVDSVRERHEDII